MNKTSAALFLTLAMALPYASRAQTSAAHVPPSLQALDLRCQVVSEDLRVGSLSLAVTGGRVFLLPPTGENAQEIPRLTKQSLEVREDPLGLLNGAVAELDRFRTNASGASVLYNDGGRWNLRVANTESARDGRETVTIDLTQDRRPEEGGTRSKFVGFCQQTTRSQDPLSADETSAMLSGPGDRQAEVLRNTLDASPPPAPTVSRSTDRTRSQPTERTPESATLPLQNFQCAIVSDEAGAGDLQFTMGGGRGYLEPDGFSTRTEVATTQRKMKVDRDSLGLFANKYPIGDLRNQPGPFERFQDSDGANWSLRVGSSFSGDLATSRENRDSVDIVRMSFEPARTRRAEAVQPRAVQRYVGLCRRSSTRQTALSSDERREELWQ